MSKKGRPEQAALFSLVGDLYLVSRMRFCSDVYFAPYLSRIGCVALKNAALSAGTNCTPAAFSFVSASPTYLSHNSRCSICTSRECFLMSAWSAGESLSQLTLE